MAQPKVLLDDGDDLVALGYVNNLLDIKESKTFRQAKLITNIYNITVDNADDYFSVNKAGSHFQNSDWRYTGIRVRDRSDNLIWKGVIIDIKRDHDTKMAVLICKSSFFKFRNEIIDYQSSTWETGSQAFKNICDSIGFEDYHQKSYQDSHDVLDANSCYLMCEFNEEDGVKFFDAINTLAKVCNVNLYIHLDEMYFVHWVPFTAGVKVSLNANNRNVFKKSIIVDSPEKNLLNDYKIDYDGSLGVMATDSANGDIGSVSRSKYGIHNNGSTFRTGTGQAIVYKDKVSAVYIGKSLIYKTHRGDLAKQPVPPTRILWELFADQQQWIDLGSFFDLTFPDEGWVDETFEMVEFTIDDDADRVWGIAYGA